MTPLDATIENRDDFQNAERNSVHAVNSVKSPPAENECLFFTDLPPVPLIDLIPKADCFWTSECSVGVSPASVNLSMAGETPALQ